MTGEAIVLGRHGDGTTRCYALDPQTLLLHLLGADDEALCGLDRGLETLEPDDLAHAQQIEALAAPEVSGYARCSQCRQQITAGPDPEMWGPANPSLSP